MARPCKVIDSQSRHNTKEEIEKRKAAEEALKGNNDKITTPPTFLSDEEKKIYKYIVNELVDVNILTNLDVFILCKFSTTFVEFIRLRELKNKNLNALIDSKVTKASEKNSEDFYKCIQELSLSPQARAKLANLALQNKEEREDPLLKILSGADDEE